MFNTSKKRSKLAIAILFLLVALMVGAYFTIPTFIYNQYESEFRKAFGESYEISRTIDEQIEIRRHGLVDGKVTLEEHRDLGKQILASIKRSKNFLDEGNSIIDKQGEIPFLPKKFLEYHQGKQATLSEYTRLQDNFLLKKENDHMLTDTTMMLYTLNQSVLRFDEPEWWDMIRSIAPDIRELTENIKTLNDRKYVTDEYYDYLLKNLDMLEFMYDQSLNVSEADSWEVFDLDMFEKVAEARNKYDYEKIFKETGDIGLAQTDKYQTELGANDEELYKWGRFYQENLLFLDPLSRMLMYVTDYYPKNFVPQDDKSPSIVPTDANPEVVS